MCANVDNIKEVISVKVAEIYTTHTYTHTHTHLNSAKQDINEINFTPER